MSLIHAILLLSGVVLRTDPPPNAIHNDANPRERSVGHLSFQSTPLEQALDELASRSGTAIVVDWPALTDGRIAGDIPIRLDLADATLGEALDAVLRFASRPGEPLDYTIERNVCRVSTRTAFRRTPVVIVYDCAALLKGDLSAERERRLDESVSRLWRQHYAVFTPPYRAFDSKAHRPHLAHRQDTDDLLGEIRDATASRSMKQIAEAVRGTIDRDGWRDNVSLRIVGDKLVIAQTPANHRAIRRLLTEL